MTFLSELFAHDDTGEDWLVDPKDKKAVDAQVLTAVRLMTNVLQEQLDMSLEEAATKIRWAAHVIEGS